MENYGKKIKLTIKHGQIPVELKAFTTNDERSHDQQQLVSKDAGMETGQTEVTFDDQQANTRRKTKKNNAPPQTNLTTIMLDEEKTNLPLHFVDEDVEIRGNSSHQFDTLHQIMNTEDMRDKNPVIIAMENSDNASGTPATKNRRVVETFTKERSLSTINFVHDMGANIDPIVGYAKEPLLPLFKACAPLTNIIYNLSFYIQIALNETPEEPSDALTIDESAAIRLYTLEWEKSDESLYFMLNNALKNKDRSYLQPYFKYLKLFVTALAKLPCLPPLIVWRGVTKDLSGDFPPGTSITWWSFSSCTKELTVLENNMYLGQSGDRTLFSVEAINGRTICDHSHFSAEDEILLLPGTRMVVQSQFSPAPALHFIHLKQERPRELLLEPPFEGNFNIFPSLFQIIILSILRCTTLSKKKVSLIVFSPTIFLILIFIILTRRPWYRTMRFIIPIGSMTALLIAVIIIGTVFGTRSKNNGGIITAHRYFFSLETEKNSFFMSVLLYIRDTFQDIDIIKFRKKVDFQNVIANNKRL